MRWLLLVSAVLVGATNAQQASQERVVTQGRITTSGSSVGAFAGSLRDTPCSPNPCGPNTRCELASNNVARCRCIDDYVPEGNTIRGCKPQCSHDDDCPDEYRCQRTKCERVCGPGACGTLADCRARNHRAECSCPPNYSGDPTRACRREHPEIRVAPPAPPLNPCDYEPCGINAECKTSPSNPDRPVCFCPVGYEGDPLTRCTAGECTENVHCRGNEVCQGLRCIDPCLDVELCGRGTICRTRQHQPICSCEQGFSYRNKACHRIDPCDPDPCGANTRCNARGTQAVCSCLPDYYGNPLDSRGCQLECSHDDDCSRGLMCERNHCVNPCREGACGENAYCDVRARQAVCSCPQYYQGDGYSRCYAECTEHNDCASNKACIELRCADPCIGACGDNANCKVTNHQPICSCPSDRTGDPFVSCRRFTLADLCNPSPCGRNADCTPGQDIATREDRPVCSCPVGYIGNPLVECLPGTCRLDDDCSANEVCYNYECQNACYHNGQSVCGDNANCVSKRHKPICSCPRGYEGDPRESCYPRARTTGRG